MTPHYGTTYIFTTEQKEFAEKLINWLKGLYKQFGETNIVIRRGNPITEANVNKGLKRLIKQMESITEEDKYDEWDRRILQSLREDYIKNLKNEIRMNNHTDGRPNPNNKN